MHHPCCHAQPRDLWDLRGEGTDKGGDGGGGSSLKARGYRSRTFKLRGEAEGHGWGCGRGARRRGGRVGGGRGVTIGSVGLWVLFKEFMFFVIAGPRTNGWRFGPTADPCFFVVDKTSRHDNGRQQKRRFCQSKPTRRLREDVRAGAGRGCLGVLDDDSATT